MKKYLLILAVTGLTVFGCSEPASDNEIKYEQVLREYEAFADSLSPLNTSGFTIKEIEANGKRSRYFYSRLQELEDTTKADPVKPTLKQQERKLEITNKLVSAAERFDASKKSE